MIVAYKISSGIDKIVSHSPFHNAQLLEAGTV